MRDPNRIDAVVEALRKLWHECPDMRLGQLLLNLGNEVAPETYSREDDEWLRLVLRPPWLGCSICGDWRNTCRHTFSGTKESP